MVSNEVAIALIFISTLVVAFLGWRNSRSEQQNADLFRATGELKSPKYLVLIFLLLGVLGSILSIATDHHRGNDVTWPMGLFGLAGLVFVLIRSFFGIRLDARCFCFGWRCGQVVAYSDVAEFERRSDGRNAVLVAILRSGSRRRIGSSIPCEWLLIDELKKRTGCSFTYRLGGRVVPQPEYLALQSSYEKFKPSARK
jgi:hypothetical protein